ncbi:MAG: shikimate dehydrogenase [Chloroflexota bacterium]|nr:shikimate dehydrogenase [Chloroflexota bacterium]
MTEIPSFYALGLIGHPLEHSLSPQLHHAGLDALGLEGEYRLYEIPPFPDGEEMLVELLTRVRKGKIHGLNVTIPHKQNVIPLLDEMTPTAEAIGAVNTIVARGGQLIGDNTDAPGFWADVCQRLNAHTFEHSSALILGAGGAARAVAYALLSEGWSVIVAARRPEQVRNLCDQFSAFGGQISAAKFSNYPLSTPHSPLPNPHYKLLVNCTPVGMHPYVGASPWPQDLAFPPDAAVYDLVYNPRQTCLVREARAAGLPAVTGLGMLVEQAALAFDRWVGRDAPREAMWAAVNIER